MLVFLVEKSMLEQCGFYFFLVPRDPFGKCAEDRGQLLFKYLHSGGAFFSSTFIE